MNAGGVPNTCKSSVNPTNETSVDFVGGKRRTGEYRVGNLPYTGG
jgi:hypothetical protein